MKILRLIIASSLILLSCNNELSRTNIVVNKESFLGIFRGKTNQDLELFSKDFKNAFNLIPLEQSKAKVEIRIYYLTAFYERFFQESMYEDSSEIDLMNCKTDRRSDSIFMTTGTIIRAKGKVEKQIINKIKYLPVRKVWEDLDEPTALDGGDVYFIEIKSAEKIKRIYIDAPFRRSAKDIEATKVSDFLKSISSSYKFKFSDSWSDIDSTAFRKK